MKRIVSVLLALCMMSGMLAMMAPAASAVTHGYVLGDADDSGSISMPDVLLIRKYIASQIGEKALNLLAADANKDENHSMPDVILVRKMIVGEADEEGNNTDDKYKIDTITVDSKNISRYTIVIPAVVEDSWIVESVKLAARELQDYIDEACGILLNITTDDKIGDAYKIEYRFDKEDRFGLGTEGYRMTVDENSNILFYCGSMRGHLYVTYYFLEELVGYRFLTSNREMYKENSGFRRWGAVEYLYEAENINIPAGYDETEVPYFTYRAVSQGGSCEDNFIKLRLNAVDGAGSNNCTRDDGSYGWGLGTMTYHGHSYEYQVDGIHSQNQPCLSEENVYEQILAKTIKDIEDRKTWGIGRRLGYHYTQVSVSPNDNTNFCQCSKCKAVYEVEGSISGTVFRMSNRVAEALDEIYPGIEVFTIAYWDARNPPLMTRPHDNVCVCFCFGGCNNHPYDQTELCAECGGNPRLSSVGWDGSKTPQSNTVEMELFNKWCELTNNIYTWYYAANFIYYLAPSPIIFNIYNDYRYMAECGISGVYAEGGSRSHLSFEWLVGYLESKMLWNPFISEEEYNDLINEYLMIYYGDGWKYIREYLEMSNYASDLEGCWTNNFDRPYNMFNKEYMGNNFEKFYELFENAKAATDSAEQKFRIDLLTVHAYWLGLGGCYERLWVNGSESDKAFYADCYGRLYDLIVKNEITLTSSANKTDYDKYGCQNFPSSRDDIIDPIKWIYDDWDGTWVYVNGSWQ